MSTREFWLWATPDFKNRVHLWKYCVNLTWFKHLFCFVWFEVLRFCLYVFNIYVLRSKKKKKRRKKSKSPNKDQINPDVKNDQKKPKENSKKSRWKTIQNIKLWKSTAKSYKKCNDSHVAILRPIAYSRCFSFQTLF